MRARSWALRDVFPDVLKGIGIREEAQDIDVTWHKPEPIAEPKRTGPVTATEVAEHHAKVAKPPPHGSSGPLAIDDWAKEQLDSLEEEPHLPTAEDLLPPEEQAHLDEITKPEFVYRDPETGEVIPNEIIEGDRGADA